MKKLITILYAVIITASVFAQAPQKMSYQAVVRNSSNALVTSKSVGMRISILQGTSTGTEVYVEIYNPNPTTNANGLVTIEIGGGIPVTGTFSAINWATGPYFIKTETDPLGGTEYTIAGTSQLLSVPYAMFAANIFSTQVSAIQPLGCTRLAAVTTTYQKIGDLGSFSKLSAGSFIELNLQTNLYTETFTDAAGIVYELRIDETATVIGNATFLLKTAGISAAASITGIFSGLSSGSHTVSLWAKSANGSATNAYWDAGCFNSAGTNNLYVKEYK